MFLLPELVLQVGNKNILNQKAASQQNLRIGSTGAFQLEVAAGGS
jgi:hypothetical protein